MEERIRKNRSQTVALPATSSDIVVERVDEIEENEEEGEDIFYSIVNNREALLGTVSNRNSA